MREVKVEAEYNSHEPEADFTSSNYRFARKGHGMLLDIMAIERGKLLG